QEGLRRFSQLRARLEALWQNLLTARGPEIDTKEPLIPLIESLGDLTLIPPMTPLFEILKKELIALDEPDPIKRALNAAEWCIRHFMIPQAYALMREAIITGLCRAGGYDPFDEKIREEFIGGILYILAQKLPREQWKAELKSSAQEVEHFMNKGGSALEELAKAFDPLRRYRNDLLHAGWKRERTSAKSLVVNANTHHQELVSAFENLGHFREDSSRRALVVISHELTSDQAEELRSIWLVKEIVFLPEELARMWENLPPEAESVEEAVEPILKWLLQKSYLGDLVVVQGEHGATLKVALFAYSIGLVPIYATTKRVLQETRLPDGSVRQERIFKHVRFRKYFC
ncbi:MAG: CRISPR-associated protein Csx20, partial [candidate division WOR-3 bacterium]